MDKESIKALKLELYETQLNRKCYEHQVICRGPKGRGCESLKDMAVELKRKELDLIDKLADEASP